MNVSDASSLARARRARLTARASRKPPRKGVPQAAAQGRPTSRRARLTARASRKPPRKVDPQGRPTSRRARLTARVNPTIYDAAPRATLRVKGQAHVVGRDGLSGGVGGRGRRTTQGVPRPYGYRAASEAGSCRTWLLGVSARDFDGFLSDFARGFLRARLRFAGQVC